MVSYPVELVAEHDGSYRVVSPHFPEFESFGDNEDDALLHAMYALEEVISVRIAKRQVVPVPIKFAPSHRTVALPKNFAGLLESYWKFNLGAFPPDRRP
jgi:antitoxin HicB